MFQLVPRHVALRFAVRANRDVADAHGDNGDEEQSEPARHLVKDELSRGAVPAGERDDPQPLAAPAKAEDDHGPSLVPNRIVGQPYRAATPKFCFARIPCQGGPPDAECGFVEEPVETCLPP